jgi:hypothetical protein
MCAGKETAFRALCDSTGSCFELILGCVAFVFCLRVYGSSLKHNRKGVMFFLLLGVALGSLAPGSPPCFGSAGQSRRGIDTGYKRELVYCRFLDLFLQISRFVWSFFKHSLLSVELHYSRHAI